MVVQKLVVLSIALVALAGCEDLGLDEEEGGGTRSVTSEDEANTVAVILYSQGMEPVRVYSTTTWDNEIVDGRYGGSATVNGSYIENDGVLYSDSTEEYANVTIEYDGYCSKSDYPAITGRATVSGKLTKYSSTRGTTYRGGWSLEGVATLTPQDSTTETWNFALTDISFRIGILNYDYNGTVTVDGTTYSVNSNY